MLLQKHFAIAMLAIVMPLCVLPSAYCSTLMLVSDDSVVNKGLQEKYLESVQHKASFYSNHINAATERNIRKVIQTERAMRNKLAKIDSAAARRVFDKAIDSLKKLDALSRAKARIEQGGGRYNGYLDSLKNTVAFLEPPRLNNTAGDLSKTWNKASTNVTSLESSLQNADVIQQYLQQQKGLLQAQLSKYTVFNDDLKQLNKQVYYCRQEINDLKETLHDEKKAEARVLQVVRKLPAYQDFLKKHSMLASLFNLPAGGDGGVASLEGLQTRDMLGQVLQQRLGNNPAAVNQQMDAAREQLDNLKNKYSNLGSTGEMPDFKPSEMKRKRLLQRLEFGANIQFEKSAQLMPASTDIAGQVGYKLNQNSTIGIGASYRLGLGQNFSHIRFSSQGASIRSYLDWKIKNSFFAYGGFEQNYNVLAPIANGVDAGPRWEKSALLGLSKKYRINNKLKGNIQLLYDFFWDVHIPTSQPILVRLGYLF